MLPPLPEQAPPEEMHLYSKEAEQDLIAISLKLAREKIENWKQSHHPDLHDHVVEHCMEEHERREGRIMLYFHQRRTGLPF
jgi:hypothetical protein